MPRKQSSDEIATALAVAEQLRHAVLYQDADLAVLNKPPGLAVQGGPGIRLSLDALLPQVLECSRHEVPR